MAPGKRNERYRAKTADATTLGDNDRVLIPLKMTREPRRTRPDAAENFEMLPFPTVTLCGLGFPSLSPKEKKIFVLEGPLHLGVLRAEAAVSGTVGP